MVQRKNQVPEIVTHAIPHIEVYQVTDDELDRIEESSSQESQDFAFMLTSISLGIAFLIALMTATFEETIKLIFIAAVGVCAVSAVYTGLKWIRNRKKVSNVIDKIRSRRIDPEA